MQGFAEKKKEVPKLFEEEKKKPAPALHANSMSEGPMLLKESLSIEQRGRASFEQSVKIELAAMKKRRDKKKKGKARRRKGKAKKRTEGK